MVTKFEYCIQDFFSWKKESTPFYRLFLPQRKGKKRKKNLASRCMQKARARTSEREVCFLAERRPPPLAINMEGERKTTFTKTLAPRRQTRRKAWKFLPRKESAKHTNTVSRVHSTRGYSIFIPLPHPPPSPPSSSSTSTLIFHPSRGRRRITRERFALLIRAHAPERTNERTKEGRKEGRNETEGVAMEYAFPTNC